MHVQLRTSESVYNRSTQSREPRPGRELAELSGTRGARLKEKEGGGETGRICSVSIMYRMYYYVHTCACCEPFSASLP